MKILFKNKNGVKPSFFHQTVLKMLALVNKDGDYQDLSVEDIELVVTEIDSINALYNCSQKTLLNINQVNSF